MVRRGPHARVGSRACIGFHEPMTDYDATKAAARANRAFYRAFEKLDLEAMRAVWLDDDGVKCVHPGWRVLVGWKDVMDSWRSIFSGTTSVRFELAQVDLRRYGSFALATCEERVHLVDGAGERRFSPSGLHPSGGPIARR